MGQVGEVSADALWCRVCLAGCSSGAGMLVAKCDVRVSKIADRLDAAPSERCWPENTPRFIGQPVGFAVAAAEQKLQRVAV